MSRLHELAFEYRNASTLDAQGAWEELERYVQSSSAEMQRREHRMRCLELAGKSLSLPSDILRAALEYEQQIYPEDFEELPQIDPSLLPKEN